jgi:hypothetical protein
MQWPTNFAANPWVCPITTPPRTLRLIFVTTVPRMARAASIFRAA